MEIIGLIIMGFGFTLMAVIFFRSLNHLYKKNKTQQTEEIKVESTKPLIEKKKVTTKKKTTSKKRPTNKKK